MLAVLSAVPLGGRKCRPGHWNRTVDQFSHWYLTPRKVLQCGVFGAAGLRNPLTLKLFRLSWAIVKTSTMIAYGENALTMSVAESRSGLCCRTNVGSSTAPPATG